MTRHPRRPAAALRGDRGGATALEFALVAIPLVLLIFGVVEFARLLFVDQVIEQAAAETARCIAVRAPQCSSGGSYSASAATSYLQSWLSDAEVSTSGATVSLVNASCAGMTGFSSVSVSYTFQTALPGLFASLSAGLPLTALACFPNQS